MSREFLQRNRHCILRLVLLPCLVVATIIATMAVAARDAPLAECLADRIAEPAKVAKVTDGDTLVLGDGQRVRIIGINTLELNARSRASRASARAATDALRTLIGNREISLLAGPESHDQHGRRLAHVLNDQGMDVGSELIRRGYATAVAVAENTRCADYQFALEALARSQARGIWKQPSEWFIDEDKLAGNSRGFKLMQTTITSIKAQGKDHVIRFSNGISARLGKHWPGASPDKMLLGTRVEIRGWVSGKHSKPKLTLHHPLNMRILSD